MRPVTALRLTLLLGALVAVGYLLLTLASESHCYEPWGLSGLECMNNLRILGSEQEDLRSRGQLEALPGAEYLLQVAPGLKDRHLKHFLCPCDLSTKALDHDSDDFVQRYRRDWRTAPCSYRGPDAKLLAEIRGGPFPKHPRIIACDMNGSNGDRPHHEHGVVVLFENGDVDFIEWDEIEGSDGDPVPVGPNSPDTRFRHLIR